MVDLSVVEQSAGGNLRNLIQHDPVLQQPLKIQLMSLVSELEDNRASDMRNSPVTEQISKMIMRAGAEQVQTTPLRMDNPSVATKLLLPEEAQARIPELFRAMEQSPAPIARELVQGAKAIVEQAIDGKVMKEMMQGLFKSLGFNYEAGLLNGNQEITRMMDMLKPQLVALLHDSAISPALRDAVETVIARMNGTLLHSSDTGLNQQIVMQLPLEFLGKRIDATIQWNGRKKRDGKIDADFARILFYLDLESLNKTIIDMQVQNRVVTLTIFNENHEVREIGNMLQTKLREGLETVDYRLSGVSFKNIEEEEIGDSKRRNELMTDHGGVDFRI